MAKKITVGLCTSGSRLVAAVSAGGRLYAARRKVYNQERVLYGVLEGRLRRAGGSLRDVGAVCAARGPGRFTGTRIALTLAGVLKELSGAEVLTATVFEILALQACGTRHFSDWKDGGGRTLAVLLHAFKDEYFCQFFEAGRGAAKPRAVTEPAWLPEAGVRELLASRAGPLYCVADEEERPGIYSLLPAGAERAPAAVSRVLPGGIIAAARAWGSRTLRPLYLKPAKYELGPAGRKA